MWLLRGGGAGPPFMVSLSTWGIGWGWLEMGSQPGGWKRAWASDMAFPLSPAALSACSTPLPWHGHLP